MLAEQEREWLERRKNLCVRCFVVDFRDAAEFEARVAEKLAKSICVVCPDNKNGSCQTSQNYSQRAEIEACRMRHARLAVEQEMDIKSN